MKKKLRLFFTPLFFLVISCSNSGDHSEIGNVYNDLVIALKAKDDAVLRSFCYKIVPDEATLNYMRTKDLCYRGIPCKMDEQNATIDVVVEQFFPALRRIRNSLIADGLLDDLSHINNTNYKWGTELVNGINIRGTEMPIKFKSGETTISYTMGEMVFLDQKWSLFTKPNVDYSKIKYKSLI